MHHMELLLTALEYIEIHLRDEFCILTASNDISYAQRIADHIRRMDGQTFLYEDQEIPLTLHIAVANIQECHRYEDVFAGLHKALRSGKSS